MTADWAGNVWVFDVSGQPLLALAGHRFGVGAVAVSHDGRRVLTTSIDLTTRLWELNSKEFPSLRAHDDAIHGMAYSEDGRYMLTTSRDCTTPEKPVARPAMSGYTLSRARATDP